LLGIRIIRLMIVTAQSALLSDQPHKMEIALMIRTLFIIIWIMLTTLTFGIFSVLFSFFDKTGNMPHIIARLWAKSILFASRINVNIQGLSRINPSGSFIYMANHQSNFDIPVLMACLPVQFRWLAKSELFGIPFFGYVIRRAGYISIDRSNRRSAFKSLKKAAAMIKAGTSVCIFPEGTRSHDGHISSFKKGGIILAIDSGAPIIPVVIHGTWPIMPKNRLKICPGNVTVEFLPPVETSAYTRKEADVLQRRIREIICNSFESKQRGNPVC